MRALITEQKPLRLFIILGGFFIANALVAEFIGVKIFSLEKTLGLDAIQVALFGQGPFSLNLSAGVLLWPVVFVLTDVINEYYGKKGVRLLSFLAVGLIAYAFLMISMAIWLAPADFWIQSHIPADATSEIKKGISARVGDYNYAFSLVFRQGLWIIVGSLVAFLVGQFLDVWVFHAIKRMTGEKKIWLRATGSTLISQFIDSFIVLFIAFYIGADWNIGLVFAIGLVNYSYKFLVALLLTPVIYLVHFIIEKYLGHATASEMKQKAQAESNFIV
jgi:queuosine precursor transporter